MKNNPPYHRPRVLVVTSTFPRWRGDTEPGFIHELSSRMAGHFDITVLAPHTRGAEQHENWDGLDIRRFRYAPEALETLAYQGGIQAQLKAHPWKLLLVPCFLIAQWWSVWQLTRQNAYEVVHAHWVFPQGLIAVLACHAPVVVTAHGSDLHNLKGSFFRYLQRYVLQHARAVTVVSSALANMARDLARDIKDLRILPLGIDLQTRFVPNPTVKREVATFLFVGRLVDGKGVRELLEAFVEVLACTPIARLVIIGEGPGKIHYQALASTLGIADRVDFLGAVPTAQLPNWYRRATALVGPSKAEGLGRVFIEAAGCGCPVIASDLPALREIVLNGESGLLVPSDMPSSLAAAMYKVLTNPQFANRLGETARSRVFERYDWSATLPGYLGVIEAAMSVPSA